MILIEGLYAFSLSCFYSLIASVTFYAGRSAMMYVIVPLCCTLAGMVYGAFYERRSLSLLSLPIVCVPLLFMHDTDAIVYALFPAFFLAVTVIKKFRPEHDSFGTFFLIGLCIDVGMELISVVFQQGTANPAYLYLFAASGTALLRTLRMPGSEHNLTFQKNSVLSLLAAAAVMSILSIRKIWEFILFAVKWFYFTVIINAIYAVAYVVIWVLNLVGKLLTMLFGTFHFNYEFPEIDTSLMDGEYEYTKEGYVFHDYSSLMIVRNILIVLVLVLIAAYIIHRVRNMRAAVHYDTGEVEYVREKIRTPERVSGSRGSIRRTYRKYLEYLKNHGVRYTESATSREILEEGIQAEVTGPEEAEALRRIYLSARYDMHQDPTAEDVQSAKAFWKQMKNRKQ